MNSDKPPGADDQQETESSRLELDARWVVGFVDGEGCFSVSIHRNAMVRSTGGFQLHATFQVSQHRQHRAVLEALETFFGCGHVRDKGAGSRVMVYAVDSLRDIRSHIIPFFERHPLMVKRSDFDHFTEVTELMSEREHLTRGGFERAVRLAYAMNANGKQRARTLEEVLEGSSETARRASA